MICELTGRTGRASGFTAGLERLGMPKETLFGLKGQTRISPPEDSRNWPLRKVNDNCRRRSRLRGWASFSLITTARRPLLPRELLSSSGSSQRSIPLWRQLAPERQSSQELNCTHGFIRKTDLNSSGSSQMQWTRPERGGLRLNIESSGWTGPLDGSMFASNCRSLTDTPVRPFWSRWTSLTDGVLMKHCEPVKQGIVCCSSRIRIPCGYSTSTHSDSSPSTMPQLWPTVILAKNSLG